MDGNTHTLRWIAALVAVLAAMLFTIPLANASQRNRQPNKDGWYYTVLSEGKARGCQTNHTYQQAGEAGQLPAIMALHGGAPIENSLLACGERGVPQDVRDHRAVARRLQQERASKILSSDGYWIFRHYGALGYRTPLELIQERASKILSSDGHWIFRHFRYSADPNRNAKYRATAAPVNPAAATVEGTGFNWPDAAIGAAAAVLMMLLLAGGRAARRRRILAAHL